jgi:hypothetical protein
MENTISLRPQYTLRPPSSKNTATVSSNTNTKINTVNKSDIWGIYKSPYTNENKEYISELTNCHYNPHFDYGYYQIMDRVMPMYRNLLKGNEFNKFYFRKRFAHSKPKSRKFIIQNNDIDNKTAGPEKVVVVSDDVIDEDDILEDSDSGLESEYSDDELNEDILDDTLVKSNVRNIE